MPTEPSTVSDAARRTPTTASVRALKNYINVSMDILHKYGHVFEVLFVKHPIQYVRFMKPIAFLSILSSHTGCVWALWNRTTEKKGQAHRGETRRQWELDFALWAWQTAEDSRYADITRLLWIITPSVARGTKWAETAAGSGDLISTRVMRTVRIRAV